MVRAFFFAALLGSAWVTQAAAGVAGGGTDFTPHGTQPGLLAGMEEPISCESCHSNPGQSEAAFLAHDTWSGSLMANATRDPLFWAALDVAERDVPGVGDWCLRCHTPVGWLNGHVRKDGQGGFVSGTNGCLLGGDHDDIDSGNNDYSGVTCHQCHRMTRTGPAGQVAPRIDSGNFWVDDSLSCDSFFGPCRYGSYAYGANDPIQAPHGARFSRFTTSGDQCGTCHDVSSPLVNGVPLKTLKVAGVGDTGRAFPAERTFSEWRQSRYGNALARDSFEAEGFATRAADGNVDCQDCHMRVTPDPSARACMMTDPGVRAGQLPVHEFVGGGVWPLRLVRGLYGGVGGLDRLEAFDRTIAWTLEMLQQRSADLAVTLDAWPGGTNPLTARVRVTNKAGHKLPTGYGEGRRMWLNVQVRDATNALVFESGAWDPATGTLANDAQLKVYEVLQGIWNGTSCTTEDGLGRKAFHFVLNDCVAKDNRIPPEGFRPTTGSDPQGYETRPVAYSYPETAPGSGVLVNHDETVYTVPVPPGAVAPLQVTATLQYQTASREYIDFLRNEAVENAQPTENQMCNRSWTVGPAGRSRGQFLYELWTNPAYGRSPPVPMQTRTASTQ
jgi:hypothetical protein